MKRHKATVGIEPNQEALRGQTSTSSIPLLFHEEADRSRRDNVAGARCSEYVPKIDAEKTKNVAQRLSKTAQNHVGKRASMFCSLDPASMGMIK
jgi:hypothetical protein